MACSMPCCAVTCLLLSGFGVVFLIVYGILLSEKSNTIEVDHDKMENGATAAYICAAVYAGFFVLSAIYLLIHSRRRNSRGSGPESFPMQSMAEAGEAEEKPEFSAPPEPLPASLASKKLSLTRTAPDSRGDES
ncbi:transmembrane protein [Cystoisospora suis]|uniref:Transmembrane protein n=1 Tax=Cystoisospora suis TaxID=483139 RepID=A0A2C6LDE8_9APIC|nr:transmembrane protein [Cystoisospora suis]